MPGSNPIQVESLNKTFGDHHVLEDLSFVVNPAEMFIVVGPDGAGKTTLLRILAGIMPFESGQVRFLDCEIDREAELAKPHLGYMPQKFGLYEDLTVQENLDFFYSLYRLPGKDKASILKRMYEFSGLERFSRRLAGKLSGGMKQKLGLACALLHRPRVLLLDEPTNGVDPYSRRTFWNILSDFKQQGVTIVVATPFMDEAERGDRVLLLNEGRMLACDKPDDIKALWKGSLYEIYSPNSRRAKELLKQNHLVRSAVMFGNKLHVSPAGDNGIDNIIHELQKEDLVSGQPNRIEPELEDLFIHLVSNE